MRKKIKASDFRRFQQISEILGLTIDEAEELSKAVTGSLKEIKQEFDNPNINELINHLCKEKSLTEATK